MSKADAYETDLLGLLLTATAISQVAINASSSALSATWVSLHTADPGDAGNQGTSELGVTGYTRIATTRSTAGWVVASGSASPVSAITFPMLTSTSTGTITHFGVGLSSASTIGKLFYSGTVTPNINFQQNTTPVLSTASAITED